eukprot:TRINITY_DN539_c3_g1_i1.p1 TRINITY_DN539_c3_g1~~TRINITY_DN539_c3_g1_i1.p1  ORF type:complete len:190 (-),score=79.44 TRINITY_DN539_c3_g1_i1:128-697(-)
MKKSVTCVALALLGVFTPGHAIAVNGWKNAEDQAPHVSPTVDGAEEDPEDDPSQQEKSLEEASALAHPAAPDSGDHQVVAVAQKADDSGPQENSVASIMQSAYDKQQKEEKDKADQDAAYLAASTGSGAVDEEDEEDEEDEDEEDEDDDHSATSPALLDDDYDNDVEDLKEVAEAEREVAEEEKGTSED